MAAYGKYQAADEVAQNSRTTVYVAHPAGSPRSKRYVIKAFAPISLPGQAINDRVGIRKFTESFEAQRVAAGKRAKHWAPIIEAGDFPGGAYYVTRRYPRSLERLIDLRIKITSESLYHVMHSLVAALRELEKRAGRPHGNLKASNVFVARDGMLVKTRIIVSDPLPASDISGNSAAVADLKGLGTILFRLVRQRDVKGDVGWPVTASPDWDALGGKSEAWRELCNTLLDPQALAKGVTLEEVEKQLDKLKFRGARQKVFLVFLGVPGLILLAAFLYLRFAPYEKMPERLIDYAEFLGNVPPDSQLPPPEWAQLATAYYDWFGVVQTSLQDPDRRAAWRKDPVLAAQVVDVLDDAAQRQVVLDPRAITGASGNLQDLAAHPPEVVKKGAIRYRIQKAWKIVGGIRAALDGWPVPATLKADAEHYRKLGWAGPAAELTATLARNQARPDTAESIDDYLAVAARAEQADAAFIQTQRHAEALAATNDAFLAGLADYYRAPARDAADLAALTQMLVAANQNLARWVAFARGPWAKDVDQPRLAREGAADRQTGPVTAARIDAWQNEVRDYTRVTPEEDPRRTADLRAAGAALDRSIEQYRNEEKGAPPTNDPSVVPGEVLAARVKALAGDVSDLLAASVVRKDIAPTRERIAALSARQRTLADQISSSLVLLHPDVADWIKSLGRPLFADTPSVQRAWQEQTRLLLGSVNPRALAADPARFRTLRLEARSVETLLRDLAAPQTLAAAAVPPEAGDPDVRAQLDAWLAQRRDAALGSIMASIDWNGVMHGADAAAVLAAPAAAAARAGYDGALRDASALAADLRELRGELAAGRGLDEGVDEVARRAAARPATSELLRAGPIGQLAGAVEGMRRLAASSDPALLSASAGQPPLAAGLTAWRRLGALGTWPARPSELEAEGRLEQTLKGQLETADPDAKRQALLAAEFAREAQARWRRALAGSSALADADVAAVFARMGAFGVSFETLDEPARYDFYLSRLKAESRAAVTSDEANAARVRFDGEVRALPAVGAQPAVAAFNAAIQGVSLVKGDPSADLRKAGPAADGWSAQPASDASSVTYTWTAAGGHVHELRFVIVELENNDPYFLCTTAMPIGLFLDLVARSPGGDFVATEMPSWIGAVQNPAEDQRQGPRVWTVDFRQSGRLRLSERWTGVRMPSWPDQIYAPGQKIEDPSRLSPVQYIDPAAAQAFVERFLHCRLPSPAEWTETIHALGGAERLKKEAWNFRDRTWQQQQAYLAHSGAAFDLPWPDADAFIPAALGPAKRGGEAVAATTADDGILWFSAVNTPCKDLPFDNLLGNVAVFLWDPRTATYAVAGGSALSPPELDPTAIYAVDTQQGREGYSDVGFRPAFSAPDSLVGKSRLSRLIRDQGFLRL